MGILRQEHYAGNWDVFRPATEIEEMNIFTAESLNELLREAEKIMEGYNSGEECNNMDNSVQGKFTVGCLIWAVNYGKMEV